MPDTYVHVPESMRKLSEAVPRDVMRDLLSDTLSRVMNAEVEALCNAAYGSRSGERENSRNGYRERDLETRMGTMSLSIPKLRRGSYLPSFLEPRRRWEKAFVQVVSEAYVLGVSTRKVEDLVEAMGAKGMGRSEVSRMAQSLDEQVRAFRERPLEKAYPYVWLDSLYVKVREGGRTVGAGVVAKIIE
jgi:transposase-like protein